tara:strand:- start:101 stop:643 length:543 start_codon:yes stop_codon:yes gene_type:complete
MSDTVDNVLNTVSEAVASGADEPSVNKDDVVVSEEAPVEEAPVEEAPVEGAPVEETPVEETQVEETSVEEAPVEEESSVEVAAVEPVAPIEQVVSDIRDILSEDHPSNEWEEETNNSSLGDGIIIVSGIHKGKKFSELLPHLLDTLREDQINVWINKQSIEGCDKINAFKYLKYFKANRH